MADHQQDSAHAGRTKEKRRIPDSGMRLSFIPLYLGLSERLDTRALA
jgi:hypothetical protein